MTWHDDLLEAMAEYLRRAGVKDVVRVTEYDESSWDVGGCPTCGGWTKYEVDIYYIDSTGKKQYHCLDDTKFTDFVQALTD